MNKNISLNNLNSLLLFFTIILLTSCFLLIGCNKTNDTIEKTEQLLDITSLSADKNRMLTLLETICATSRVVGSEDEKRVYNFLKTELESYGYTTSTQEFPYKILRLEDFRTEDSTESIYTDFTNKKADGISQNLIAIKKSNLTDTQDKDIIIISAHYDTVANSYGAIDNASGVSILMEVARVLAPVPNNSNNEIHFILFSGEENHLYGSHYYVYNLSEDEKKRIIAVINLDMVGEEGPIAPVLGTHNVKENNATKLFSNYNIEIKRGTSSDHLPFHYAGIPSLTIYQYPTDMMNTIDDILKNDIVDRIDQEKLKNIADMLIQVLIENTYTVNL